MNLRARMGVLFGALLLTLGAGAVAATPAQAAWSDCPVGAVCIFDGTSGGWPLYYWTSGGPCINIGTSWNDRASSVYNRSGSHVLSVRFHEHAGCSGDGNPATLTVYNGQMKTFGTGSGLTQYNNILSSFFVVAS